MRRAADSAKQGAVKLDSRPRSTTVYATTHSTVPAGAIPSSSPATRVLRWTRVA